MNKRTSNLTRLDACIGLNNIDLIEVSDYFHKLTEDENIKKLDINYVENKLIEFYQKKDNYKKLKSYHCDLTTLRMLGLNNSNDFEMSVEFIKYIHEEIFKDIYDYAGNFRNINIRFDEKILNFDTVKYANYKMIKDSLAYDISLQKNVVIEELHVLEKLKNLVEFNANLWQVHPFMNGNTRTVATFMLMYLRSKNIGLDYFGFAHNSFYYRNALVRSNYFNKEKGVKRTDEFLIKFYENLILSKIHPLRSSDLIVKQLWEGEVPIHMNKIKRP